MANTTMVEVALTDATSRVVRNLGQLRTNKRDVSRHIGHKAAALVKLAAAAVPIPDSWVLDADAYRSFTASHLPRKHDLKNLIKLSGTRAGDERCARAHRELSRAPLPEHVIEAVQQLWSLVMQHWPAGVTVRPSIATSSANPGPAARYLLTREGLRSVDGVLEAIVALWADSVLSCSVEAFAEADVGAAAVAVVLQETINSEYRGVLTRVFQPGGLSDVQWYLGVEPVGVDQVRRLRLLVPWAEGEGAPAAPPPLQRLRRALQAAGHEQLDEAVEAVATTLGPGAALHFRVGEGTRAGRRIHVVGADDNPQHHPLRGEDQDAGWLEIPLGTGVSPPTRLTQSVFDQVIVAAAQLTLAQQHAKLEGKAAVVARRGARSYLNLDVLLQALVDTPLIAPEEVLAALGGSDRVRRKVAGRAAAHSRRWLRQPNMLAAMVRENLALDSLVARQRRAIETDLRMVTRMDLTLLPNDAIGTTLRSAQALLERTVALWLRLGAALLGSRAALRATIARKLNDAPAQVSYAVAAPRTRSLASAMAEELEKVVAEVRRDAAVRERLAAGATTIDELPDGHLRGMLGTFISSYGDATCSALELSRPRWQEDPRELFALLLLLAHENVPPLVEARRLEAAALADQQLARYEPELSRLERRFVRWLADRIRALLALRTSVDKLVLRALSAVRLVVVDIDRRLVRIDRGMAPGGAFHCSASRLAAALNSGRPELGRVIGMRLTERQLYRRLAPPPLSFEGSPPRGPAPVVARRTLTGLPLSSGVIDGRVRLALGTLPTTMEQGEILVVRAFDAALLALYARAGAVVAAGGGREGVAAEALRELAVVAVGSLGSAVLLLRDGERVRVDGDRGVVERLDEEESPARSRR